MGRNARSAPWVMKADEMIGWDWMELEPVLTALIPMVPPGQAVRQVEKNRQRARLDDPDRPGNRNGAGHKGAAMIRYGQRYIVRSGLSSHKYNVNGRQVTIYEIQKIDGIYYIRRRERRGACNCRVGREEQHG